MIFNLGGRIKNKSMKKIVYKISIVVFVLSMFSCEGFLDRNPLDKLSNETFWSTDAEVQMALGGCYRRLRDNGYFGIERIMMDALTDNAQYKWGGDLVSISRGVIETSTGGIIDDMWGGAYAGISTCNNFLENVDKASDVVQPEDMQNYMGQVHFLRAFFYFELVQYFGDVILYKENPKTVEDAKIAQSPEAEVLEFIHMDLDSAINMLPDDRYEDGYAVKGSAQALKARVLLYEENWSEVASLTKEIIDDGTYSISSSDYRLLFIYRQYRNKEIMFSTKYLNPDDYSDIDAMLILWGAMAPRQELVDEYECIDGLSIDESPLYDPDSAYKHRDPRLGMTLMVPGEKWYNPDGSQHTPDPSISGYYQKKYVDSTRLPISTSTLSDQDFIHLRFADVLLMYAEAQNEDAGVDQSVYDAVNQVRTRVGMPDLPAGLSQSEMRDAIRHERRIELALEGLRYFDLKRWHIAHEVMPAVHDLGNIQIVFEDPKHYHWPYQMTELEVNPKLVPNPNY